MRILRYIIQKEFIQIFRNKTMLPMIFILPIFQLFILVHAATMEMRHINLFIIDMDMSTSSRHLISKFEASSFFVIKGFSHFSEDGKKEIERDKADIVITIPNNFERSLKCSENVKVLFNINAVNGMVAGLINGYAASVLNDYSMEIIPELKQIPSEKTKAPININYSYWYNPQLNFKTFMLPGILVVLVTIIGMFLTAMNIVREKELGTIEQINVTPIKKYHFIIGKLLPFWIIALFELSFGLILGKIFFEIPTVGSNLLLFSFASMYLLVILGLGLFISTLADTQQQVVFISFFFLIVFILMSGLFTPAESMPLWAQKVNLINPFYYFMKVIRVIMLKGSGLKDIKTEFISISIYAFSILSLAIWRYRKVA